MEWSVNPQYAYGWAVPFLCAYLAWRNARRGEVSEREAGSKAAGQEQTGGSRRWLYAAGFGVLAWLYLPTRLVQEANPEWRLVSWTLALEVVGLTWLVLRQREGEPGAGCRLPGRRDACAQEEWGRRDACPTLTGFALWFFLVAVPWPTVIEGPLTQALGRANAVAGAEILSLAGVPALPQGNVIEVGTGRVGIDEACSGIRSLQATVMLALFFGEVYRLRPAARGLCVAVGTVLAFIFNVGRTTALTWIAARQGMAALEAWHDAAGVGILLGCFGSLWVIARSCRVGTKWETRWETKVRSLWVFARTCRGKLESCALHHRGPDFRPLRVNLQVPGAALVIWLLAVEFGTEAWYRAHERVEPPPVTWGIEAPRGAAGYRELKMSERARQFLRYDEALNAMWQAAPGLEVQVIYLRWAPGRVAMHLARSHAPGTCLAAAGHRLIGEPSPLCVRAGGLELPFERYQFDEGAGPVFVFYCLWEDRAPAARLEAGGLNWKNRLRPVLAGRRNRGQRSLELAVRGAEGGEEAEAVARRELETILRRP